MSRKLSTKLLACLLAALTAFIAPVSVAQAASASAGNGKYISDVYVATGTDRDKARQWLIDNGWEPVADLNQDKTSEAPGFTTSVAYLGMKRTNDPNGAITDMATMNQLGGGYSFDDYEALVKQKKADINEFIMTFVPALEEYRANYNGEGSEGGQKRAQYAHDLLNKFYDGNDDEYAVNDTGKPLGDLFLNKTKTEIGDEAYNKLSKEEKMNVADLQQIILESTGFAVIAIEQILALATDANEDSWLDRLDSFTGTDLTDRIGELVPEVAGQDLAPSAALGVLAEYYEDSAKILAERWTDVHEDILWFEEYCQENGFLDDENEPVDDYGEVVEAHFTDLQETDVAQYDTEYDRYRSVEDYYFLLKTVDYSGDWGSTLYDLFRPEDEDDDYSEEPEYFAPIAVALSKGQRAALELLPLPKLFTLGMNSDDAMEAEFPSLDAIFKDEEKDSVSIYSGMNRAIFRNGVAITSKARMQKNLGRDPYDEWWDEGGIANIIFYSAVSVGFVTCVTGAVMAYSVAKDVAYFSKEYNRLNDLIHSANNMEVMISETQELALTEPMAIDCEWVQEISFSSEEAEKLTKCFNDAQRNLSGAKSISSAGKILMGVGAVLMIAAAALEAAQLVKFYNRDFTQIPLMIVDEADIVSYYTDENGKQQKLITFDQFAYYEVVKCNRQTVGIHKNAQSGVSDYQKWGCGDAADLNGDVGKEWLALYVNRSSAKGDPILADSLTRVYGDTKKPANSNGFLHMFCSSAPTLLDDTAYCYRNDSDKGGMYLYWQTDEGAFTATASTFNYGYLALAAIGGLALGIVGTTGIILPKRKKNKADATA